MTTKKGLAAFNLKNANIVILGTFPSDTSLNEQEYYSDSRNQFWQLLGLEKHDIKGLKQLNIGLWDVIVSCERDGSADKTIKNAKYNDLSVLKGKNVLFNGKKAYTYFLTALKQQKLDFKVLEKNILPSSSAALAVEFTNKKKQWEKIINKYK